MGASAVRHTAVRRRLDRPANRHWRLVPLHSMMGLAVGGCWRSVGIVILVLAGGVGPPRLAAPLGFGQNAGSAAREPAIAYHLVEGARFFDILVARIGTREHILIGETDDMCLELVDQRDFDGDGDVDLGDYNSLASNFAPGGYGPAAVPEPAAALLALLGMLVTCLSGRLPV